MARKPKYDVAPATHVMPENPQPIVQGASIFDRANPDSVINRAVGKLRAAMELAEHHKQAKFLMRQGERYLRETYKHTPQQARLRISFWDAYARAIEQGGMIITEHVYAGILSMEAFDDEYIASPEMIGYLLNIPPNYNRASEEILMAGLERYRDIIELPLIDEKGKVQSTVISGIIKVVEMLDRRVKGAVLQRVAVHQHHTSGANTPAPVPDGTLAPDAIEILEKQIQDVRSKMGKQYAIAAEASALVKEDKADGFDV